MIKKIWKSIVNNGIDRNDALELRNISLIRLLNQIYFTGFTFSLTAFIAFLITGGRVEMLFVFFCNIVFELTGLFLIYLKRYETSKLIFAFLLPIFFAVQVIFMDVGSIGESHVFTLISLISLVMYRENILIQFINIAYMCILYFATQLYMIQNDLLITPSFDPYNGIITFVFMIVGITFFIIMYFNETRKHEQEKQLLIEELEQANYELRTFSYIASHDIKEPIRVISGFANLINKQLPKELQESLSEYFDTIKRSASQLYTLIEDFASYTLISKNEDIEKQDVDLEKLISSIIDNLQESIKKYNGQIVYPNLPTIKSNNSLLFIIIKNLIENGLKYNESKVPTVNISHNETEKYYNIIITDNGIGIDEQYHEKIFEMFKRLHNRKSYQGSGIGLAIVKMSLRKLDGDIQLNSTVNEGSQFVIQLKKL